MNSNFKPAAALVGDRARAAHALWERVKGSRLAPKRQEITLALVRTLAPWMWIVEVVDDGEDFRFRQAGDRVVQFLGRRYSGTSLSELPSDPFFNRLETILARCLEQKAPVAFGPVRSAHPGKEHWEVEVIALPLSEDGEKVTALFGVVELWPIGSQKIAC